MARKRLITRSLALIDPALRPQVSAQQLSAASFDICRLEKEDYMTIPSKGKGSSYSVGESTLSSVSDYCHWKNSTGNTIVRCFRHAKERDGGR